MPRVCTVLLRFDPGATWPLLLAAIRDEFLERAWDPPAAHWPAAAPGVIGGRDRVAGGTWLAVSPAGAAVAALLNGVRLPALASGVRPSRGGLALAAVLAEGEPAGLDGDALRDYDGFHLLRATPDTALLWSWDGVALSRQRLTAGDHIVVNAGLDRADSPLVAHFAPLLAAVGSPSGELTTATRTGEAWDGWVDLVRGDGLALDDPRALVVRRTVEGRTYGSSSASLVALGPQGVRYDFTADPADPHWYRVALPA